jgi:hypothetical protein
MLFVKQPSSKTRQCLNLHTNLNEKINSTVALLKLVRRFLLMAEFQFYSSGKVYKSV